MLNRIRAFFSGAAYRPLPTQPVAESPPVSESTEIAQTLAGDLAHWGEVFAEPLEGLATFKCLNIASCMRTLLQVLSGPAAELPAEALVRVLGSAHLLQAVVEIGESVDITDSKFIDEIQTSYLVALYRATRYEHLDPQRTLGLLVGQNGRVDSEPPVSIASYAHSLPSRKWISSRQAEVFSGVVDHALRSKALREGDDIGKSRWRTDLLLLQKGYGAAGRSNFYSALALAGRNESRDRILHALDRYELLPSLLELEGKVGSRGGELREALAAAQARMAGNPGAGETNAHEWITVMLAGSLSEDRLQCLRDTHHTELARSEERNARLQRALADYDLR